MTLCLTSQTILAGTRCHVFVCFKYNLAMSGPLIFLIFVEDKTCLKTAGMFSDNLFVYDLFIKQKLELCSVDCQMSWFLFCSWLFHRELFIIT